MPCVTTGRALIGGTGGSGGGYGKLTYPDNSHWPVKLIIDLGVDRDRRVFQKLGR